MATDDLTITGVSLTERGIELDGFHGEGNPSDDVTDLRKEVFVGPDGTLKVYLSLPEQEALKALLERETTSRPSYDGLRQLLSLTHPQVEALLGFLRRI